MRARNQSRAPEAHANRQPSRRSAHRGVEWAWRPVAVAGMATVGSLFVVAPDKYVLYSCDEIAKEAQVKNPL